jgi:hypothetical protein
MQSPLPEEKDMWFTVTHQGGMTCRDFEAYASLLCIQGSDLGNVPRIPAPGEPDRWLHVWNSEKDARAFVKELKNRTKDRGWKVLPVSTPPERGPLGPILLNLTRRPISLGFELHPLTEAMIQGRFPGSCRWRGVSLDVIPLRPHPPLSPSWVNWVSRF